MNTYTGNAGVGRRTARVRTWAEQEAHKLSLLRIAVVVCSLLCLGLPLLWNLYIYSETFLNDYLVARAGEGGDQLGSEWTARYWEASPYGYITASLLLGLVGMVLASTGLELAEKMAGKPDEELPRRASVTWWFRPQALFVVLVAGCVVYFSGYPLILAAGIVLAGVLLSVWSCISADYVGKWRWLLAYSILIFILAMPVNACASLVFGGTG